MSVLEIVGGNDRRSMIKRYERKSKQEAIRELVDIIHCNWNQVEQLEATCETLRGLQPAAPPRPPEGEGLPRYGLRWNGPSQPISVPMDDGYWTPWHLAAGHSEYVPAALVTATESPDLRAALADVTACLASALTGGQVSAARAGKALRVAGELLGEAEEELQP